MSTWPNELMRGVAEGVRAEITNGLIDHHSLVTVSDRQNLDSPGHDPSISRMVHQTLIGTNLAKLGSSIVSQPWPSFFQDSRMYTPSLIGLIRQIKIPSFRTQAGPKRRRPGQSRIGITESLEQRVLLSAAAISSAAIEGPVITGFGGTLTYMKGGNQLSIAPNLVVSDAESSNLSSATISFANWETGDRLAFYNSAALQYSFSENLTSHTSTLTLTGTNTLAAYETELQSLAFFNVAGAPSTATRVASIQVSDGIATSTSVSENIQFGVAPVLSGFGGTLTYVQGGSPLSFASNIVIADSESSTLDSATISFTNWQAGDRLSFYNSAALQHVFTEDLTNHVATLTFTGVATLAAYQANLQSMMFFNVAGAPVTTARNVTIQVNDGTANSNLVSESITFGQAPVLSGFGGTLTYTKGGPTLMFAPTIVISESGGSTISGATVSFVNWENGDRLSFSNSAALQYTFSENLTAHTSVLTLTGVQTLSAYQTELRSVGFFNVAGAPVTTTRVATIQVNSDGAESNADSENIAFKIGVPTISIASASANQSSTATTSMPFTVTLSNASTSAVTVAYTTSDQTAAAGSDYTTTSGTLTIPAGQTSATINVPILPEPSGDPNETFALTLSSPTNATLGTATAVGTIISASATTTLSDNTSDTTAGTQVADSTHYLAASFESGSNFSYLQSVTLLLDSPTGGNVTLAIYTGSGTTPDTFAGTLTSPTSISTTLARTTFTTSGLVLVPNEKYWFVLEPTSGTFNWAFTNSTTGIGTGYLGQWASSANAGSTWTGFSMSPLQMDVELQ